MELVAEIARVVQVAIWAPPRPIERPTSGLGTSPPPSETTDENTRHALFVHDSIGHARDLLLALAELVARDKGMRRALEAAESIIA